MKRKTQKYRAGYATLFLRLPVELREKIDEIAVSTGLTATDIGRNAIEKEIRRIEKSTKKADTQSMSE